MLTVSIPTTKEEVKEQSKKVMLAGRLVINKGTIIASAIGNETKTVTTTYGKLMGTRLAGFLTDIGTKLNDKVNPVKENTI